MDKIGLRQVLPDVFADNPPVGSEIWRRDVTFDKGRVYLVEAASGSGKSSFCGYLYGYRRDYSGTILFDDRDIRELSVGEWSGLRCRSLAMMFQGLRLFPELSAVDNVRLKNNLTGRRSEAEIAWLFEALVLPRSGKLRCRNSPSGSSSAWRSCGCFVSRRISCCWASR